MQRWGGGWGWGVIWNLNFKGLEMEKWNKPPDRNEIVDKKWGHLSS